MEASWKRTSTGIQETGRWSKRPPVEVPCLPILYVFLPISSLRHRESPLIAAAIRHRHNLFRHPKGIRQLADLELIDLNDEQPVQK